MLIARLEELMVGLKITKSRHDVATHWNSTFYMLQSLVKQKQAIAAYGVEYKLPATLNTDQWTLVENILTILDPCEQLTRNISKATATTADVIPSIQALTRLLKQTVPTDHGVKTKETLLKAVQRRFGDNEEKPSPRYWTQGTRTATSAMHQNANRERGRLDRPQSDEPPAKRTREDENNNNSLLGMFEAILEENTDAATEQQENSRVDADVSVYFILIHVL